MPLSQSKPDFMNALPKPSARRLKSGIHGMNLLNIFTIKMINPGQNSKSPTLNKMPTFPHGKLNLPTKRRNNP